MTDRRMFLASSLLGLASAFASTSTGLAAGGNDMARIAELVSSKLSLLTDSYNAQAKTLITPVYNVVGYGAKGDGVTDDTAAIQAAIDAAIAAKGTVFFPPGSYVVTAKLNLTAISPVANVGQFGLMIRGSGMGSAIVCQSTADVLFDFDAGATTDLQVFMSDLFMYNPGGATIALRLGRMSRYSSFERLRMYGFKNGIRFMRETYGIDFRDLYIRGSTNEAIIVDQTSLGTSGVITELRFFGGYIDNNGTSVASGDATLPTIFLYRTSNAKFYGVVFEGNYAGGIKTYGICEDILFSGCRFEEISMRFGTSGHIHILDTGSRNITFEDCKFAYDRDGTDGTKTYYLMWASDKGPVNFRGCNFFELTNTTPTDMFGTTPTTSVVSVRDCTVGNDAGYYKVVIPLRYEGVSIGATRHAYGSAAPTTGTWSLGDIVYNTSPVAAGKIGWVCITAGTPGTWKAFGAIDA